MLGDYDQALTQLEAARTAKRLLERDLADPEQAERKRQLGEDLKIAEAFSAAGPLTSAID